MSGAAEALAALDAAIAGAGPTERPGLVVALAARMAALGAGLVPIDRAPDAAAASRNLDVAEAAERLGVSTSWLYKHGGTLPCAVRLGRKLLFDAAGLDRYVQRRAGR